jgi:ATP-dependent RNA helicase DOB1
MPPPSRPGPPARSYEFKIDPFQQTAINCLEAGHSVLVAAHTSAGKTVVAEYAFAMALRDNARVIYTSPLKALSNQKYREFQDKFGDVGLMTGDVVINPSASCLVMTTEILRSMLYRGSEVVREASLIVYDEIHYLRDKERGVVWEESIVLAPRSARFAFLSATIPNAREFADWIAVTHSSPCHVVYTDYRPTPLQHFVYPAGADGMFMVVDERSNFREDAFSKAVAALNDAEAAAASSKASGSSGDMQKGGVNGKKKDEKSDVRKIVEMVIQRNFDPVIVFSFSKIDCDRLAGEIWDVDLNTTEEKKVVEMIYTSAIEVLSTEDRKLNEVTAILERVKRGVGVHHSGMLPILKELTELLFQEGLLKVLFATETFSTGLNMPAKTVVFTNVRKFDGGTFRWVSSGEYIQMSGRAGRRGLDDKGVVILMLDAKLDPATAKNMLRGAPDTLYSEFHLTYAMLLNMLKVEDASPEELMRRSYRQFQAERALPGLEAKLAALEAEKEAVHIDEEESIEQYNSLQVQERKLTAGYRDAVMTPRYAVPFLQPGRLVKVLPPGGLFDLTSSDLGAGAWGAVVNFQLVNAKKNASDTPAPLIDLAVPMKSSSAQKKKNAEKEKTVIVDVLAACTPAGPGGRSTKERPIAVSPLLQGSVPAVIGVPLEEISALSTLRVNLPQDLRTSEALNQGAKVLGEVERRFPTTGPPTLDPEEDMKVTDDGFKKVKKRLESVEKMLKEHPLATSSTLAPRLEALKKKQELAEAVRAARKDVKTATGLILQEDLRSRRRVLKRLGFVDSEGLVTKKGRTAAEISTGDELVLCELIYGGVFGSLSVSQLTALVSCFVWREKSDVRGKIPPGMEACHGALREAARRVGKAEIEAGIQVDLDTYVDSFKPDLMEVVTAWCHGAPFASIQALAGEKTFGGSLVRAIRRLEELLRQLADALKAVGDMELSEKFDEAIGKIKRDIIFAASLFL